MKHGKRYAEVAKKVDRTKLYEPEEAIALAKETAAAKFDETVEIHIRTSCDGRHAVLQRKLQQRSLMRLSRSTSAQAATAVTPTSRSAER